MATSQKYFLRLSVLFYSVVLAYLAYSTHWADTELWSITIAQKFLNEGDYSLIYKFVFNAILKTLYIFDFGNITTIHIARFIFCGFGLGVITLVYWLGNIIYEDERKALFSCLLVITSSFFLSRGFRVRSDLLACFFQILYFISFLNFIKSKQRKWIVLGLFSMVFMVFSTPKSIYFLFIILSFITVYVVSSKKWEQVFDFILWTFLSLLPFGFIVLLVNRFAFMAAFDYFASSFDGISKPDYFSLKGFYFVIRFFQENPVIVFSFLLYIWSVMQIKNIRSKATVERAFILVFFFSLGFIVLHNDRLPFFINSMMVLPIAISGWKLVDLLEHIPKRKLSEISIVILGALLLTKGSHYSERNINKNSNQDQKKVIRYLENYLKEYPAATYYDGIGSMPRTNKIFHFITPTLDSNSYDTLTAIRDNKPDIVLFSNRMFYHMKTILDGIKELGYFHMGQGVYVLSKSLEELKDSKVFKYEGPSFSHVTIVKDEFKESSPLKLYSEFAPIVLPEGLLYYQVFDFDPKF